MLKRFPDKPHEMSYKYLDILDQEGGWIGTSKGDGWRVALCHQRGGKLEGWSRHNKLLSAYDDFSPEIMDAFNDLRTPQDTILDGEWLRRRAGNKTGLNAATVWGILRWDGKWLANMEEQERWEMTQNLGLTTDGEFLKLVMSATDEFKKFFESLRDDPVLGEENEGVVFKYYKSKLVLSRKGSVKNQGHVKIKWRGGADGQSKID